MGMPHHAKWVRTPGVVNSLSVPQLKGKICTWQSRRLFKRAIFLLKLLDEGATLASCDALWLNEPCSLAAIHAAVRSHRGKLLRIKLPVTQLGDHAVGRQRSRDLSGFGSF